MDPFLGEVRTFPWSFAPRGWALCNGALLAINQNTALFSLLGAFYGGNGNTTFALPDLQGRAPIHVGSNAGQSYTIGQKAGTETVPLAATNLPPHIHAMNAVSAAGNVPQATGHLPATAGAIGGGTTINIYVQAGGAAVALAADSVSNSGTGAAHNNVQPFLVLNFCIALQGIYPSRS